MINAKKIEQLLVRDVEGEGIKPCKVVWLRESVIPTAFSDSFEVKATWNVELGRLAY